MTVRKLTMLAVAAIFAMPGCETPEVVDVNGDTIDDGPSSTTVIAPSNPTGTVTGLVLDATTGAPLADDAVVSVRLVAGTLDATATIEDGSGRFSFEGVPAGGGILVTVTAEGYTRAYVEAQLSAEVGNFPSGNAHTFVGPIEIIRLSGVLEAVVFGPDGRPVPRTDVYLDTDFEYFVDGEVRGRLHAAVQTDENGGARFEDLPDAAVLTARIPERRFLFTVPPPDIDDNGVADLTGATGLLTVAEAAITAAPVVLVVGNPTGDTSVRVVASNIEDLVNPTGSSPRPVPTPSVLGKEEEILVAFDQPVDEGSFLFRVVAEHGGMELPVEPSFQGDGNLVRIPVPALAQSGQEYNVLIEARPAVMGSGGAYRGAVTFFVEATDEAGPLGVVHFWHEEVNGTPLIDGGDFMWFSLTVPVGARDDGGQPAGPQDLLPVRVQTTAEVNGSPPGQNPDHPFEFNYLGDALPPFAQVTELLPPGGRYTASGYSTRLRLTLPAGVQMIEGMDVTFYLTFNDPAGASTTQRLRVATPAGELPGVLSRGAVLRREPPPVDAGSPEDAG